MSNRSRDIKWFFAFLLVALGVALFATGFYLQAHQRENGDYDRAWNLIAIGTALIGAGASLPFVRPWMAIVIGLVSPVVAYVGAVVVFWTIIILSAFFHYL